jgi:hypothetical protein
VQDNESKVTSEELEMDVEEVMARIRETMAEKPIDDHAMYPTFSAARAKSADGLTRFPEELYYQLEQANLTYDQVLAQLMLVESQMPVFGTFINRFKRAVHRLAVFYVNMVAERQVVVNNAVVQTLNLLVEHLERGPIALAESGSTDSMPTTSAGERPRIPAIDHAATIQSLQREVSDLRARLNNLEARMNNQGAVE